MSLSFAVICSMSRLCSVSQNKVTARYRSSGRTLSRTFWQIRNVMRFLAQFLSISRMSLFLAVICGMSRLCDVIFVNKVTLRFFKIQIVPFSPQNQVQNLHVLFVHPSKSYQRILTSVWWTTASWRLATWTGARLFMWCHRQDLVHWRELKSGVALPNQ